MALLRDLGMTTLFGNPGSTELPLFRDMPQDFQYILGLQESVVVGMADGFAQMSGNAAFVNLHSSAGTGHALGNIFTAFRNQTPLVITAGQQARSIFPYDPFLYAERATEFPQPFVKWTCEPARAEDVPLAILRAYHMAMQAPRGPVFVSVPIDDWDRPCAPISPSQVSHGTSADPALIAATAGALNKARAPVIVAGAGVGRENARAALLQLAQVHNAPVWVAPMAARAVFPEDHALFAGFLPASREAIVDALASHDVVLVLGARSSLIMSRASAPICRRARASSRSSTIRIPPRAPRSARRSWAMSRRRLLRSAPQQSRQHAASRRSPRPRSTRPSAAPASPKCG